MKSQDEVKDLLDALSFVIGVFDAAGQSLRESVNKYDDKIDDIFKQNLHDIQTGNDDAAQIKRAAAEDELIEHADIAIMAMTNSIKYSPRAAHLLRKISAK